MALSQTWTFVDGEWLEGNPGLTGPRSHAFWLASSVEALMRTVADSAEPPPM